MSSIVDLDRRRRCSAACLGVVLLVLGCDSAGRPESCSSGSSVSLEAGSCLVFEDGGQLEGERSIIEQVVRQTLSSVNDLMPIDEVRIRIIADPTRVIPELGLGGFAASGEEVLLFADPGSPQLPRSLMAELAPLLAHELHHAKRMRTAGYGSTLFEAAVSEGLADHFSVEVAGGEPPLWSKALTGSALEAWTARAMETWMDRPYDHSGWFFGTDPEIPRWTGYAIGFELVRVYVSANPDRRASDLFDEPASSFLPVASGP